MIFLVASSSEIFPLFSIFPPQGKRARNALIFYLLQEKWEIRVLARLQGWGRQLGCKAPHQTTDGRTAKIYHSFEAGCSCDLRTPTSCGAGQEKVTYPMRPVLFPCPATGPQATLASQRLLTEATGTAQAQGTLLGYPFHGFLKWGHLYLWLDNDTAF